MCKKSAIGRESASQMDYIDFFKLPEKPVYTASLLQSSLTMPIVTRLIVQFFRRGNLFHNEAPLLLPTVLPI